MVQLDTLSSLHLILEGTEPLCNFSASWAKVSLTRCSILGVALFSNWWASVISLISIRLFCFIIGSASFWQSPPGEVLLSRRIGTSFWHISARAHSIRSASLVFECSCASSSEPKSVCWFFHNLRSLLRVILRTRCLLEAVYLHPWFGSDFGSKCCRLSAQISWDGVIKESGVFIEIVFWLVGSLTFSSSKRPTRWLFVLNLIRVTVHRSWWHLACIIKLGELSHVNFVSIVSFRLGESKERVWFFNWQRQFTEGSTSLFRV